MIHARIQGLLPGGGGGSGSRSNCQKTALTTLFFLCFFSPEGVQWLFQRKLIFSKVSEGFQLFQGGGGGEGESNFFQVGGGGGSNANFYRNPYNL